VIALVPLRGGSKSIPGKNIKLLAGKPLCAWSLEAAHEAGIFDRIVVSTDSEEIANVVDSFGLPVEVIMRPAELATDTASTESVMLHIAERIEFETLVTIQATSPLVRSEDFVKARSQFQRNSLDSLLTGVRVKHFYWSKEGLPLNYDPLHRPRRQDFAGSLMENGAFYFTRREILMTTGCRLGGKIGVYEMDEDTAVEIDEPSDWQVVERLLMMHRCDSISEAKR
jgi:N-acylneuraminate cytidylyltransferase